LFACLHFFSHFIPIIAPFSLFVYKNIYFQGQEFEPEITRWDCTYSPSHSFQLADGLDDAPFLWGILDDEAFDWGVYDDTNLWCDHVRTEEMRYGYKLILELVQSSAALLGKFQSRLNPQLDEFKIGCQRYITSQLASHSRLIIPKNPISHASGSRKSVLTQRSINRMKQVLKSVTEKLTKTDVLIEQEFSTHHPSALNSVLESSFNDDERLDMVWSQLEQLLGQFERFHHNVPSNQVDQLNKNIQLIRSISASNFAYFPAWFHTVYVKPSHNEFAQALPYVSQDSSCCPKHEGFETKACWVPCTFKYDGDVLVDIPVVENLQTSPFMACKACIATRMASHSRTQAYQETDTAAEISATKKRKVARTRQQEIQQETIHEPISRKRVNQEPYTDRKLRATRANEQTSLLSRGGRRKKI
jgi:hypothetical protein